jgi:NodT family efflux transporter outer membrane factor (OMF) lipoprotein
MYRLTFSADARSVPQRKPSLLLGKLGKSFRLRRHSWNVNRVVVHALVVILAGCSSQSPNSRTGQPVPSSFSAPSSTGVATDGPWWDDFRDPILSSLIQKATTANFDVRIALERVKQARAGTTRADSRLWPSLDLTGSHGAQHSGLPEQVKQNGVADARLSRIGLEVNWEIDVFGGTRAAVSAAQAEAQGSVYSEAGTRLLITAEVARQYFVLRGAQSRLEIVERLAETQRETERLTTSRRREGQASQLDVERSVGERLATEAQIPQLRTLRKVSAQRIAALLGVASVSEIPELASAGEKNFPWPSVPGIGRGQPSELLQRRPDLLRAQQQIGADTARLQEARANRWPKFFLSALGGREDYTLNSVGYSPVAFSAVGMTFTLPIFNSGRIQSEIDAQTSRQEVAWLNYEQLVVQAVEEVENSLVSLSEEGIRRSALASATTARQASQRHATSLYREGQIGLLELLDVQRSVLASELASADSRTQEALDAVQLFKALGGGWRTDGAKQVLADQPTSAR